MGGPGIVLSKTTLASLSPKLGECLRNNLMTEHVLVATNHMKWGLYVKIIIM